MQHRTGPSAPSGGGSVTPIDRRGVGYGEGGRQTSEYLWVEPADAFLLPKDSYKYNIWCFFQFHLVSFRPLTPPTPAEGPVPVPGALTYSSLWPPLPGTAREALLSLTQRGG